MKTKNLALLNSEGAYILSVVFSFVAGVYYILVSILICKWFKQHYSKGLFNPQPEVTTAEA